MIIKSHVLEVNRIKILDLLIVSNNLMEIHILEKGTWFSNKG